MKVKAREMTKEQRVETLDALYTAAGTVRGRQAMKLFLRDLLTESERIMLGRRILIARYLLANTSYEDIGEKLHVAPNTIRRVHRWLHDQFPGFEDAIKKMEKEFERRKRSGPLISYAYLKRKYPLHFLLFPWPKE